MDLTQKAKKFCVCELNTGETVVVPWPWLFLEGSRWRCRWTSSLNKTRTYAIANPKWKDYGIEKIWAKKDTYEEAELFLAELSGLSDSALAEAGLNPMQITDVESGTSHSLPPKRMRKRKILFDEDELDSADDDDNLNKKDRTERTPKASSLALKPLPTPTLYNDSTEESLLHQFNSTESPPSTSARPYPLTPPCAYSPELEIGTEPILIETGSKPTTTSGTIAETYLKKICDIAVETFKAVEEIWMTATIMQEDITKIKAALVTHLPEGEREEVFAIKVHDTPEEFEEFCCKLEDPNFKKLVIRFMVATYGQKSIGETVRAILKASMTDSLMARYNRTGTRNMRSLPDIFEKCIFSTVKSFYKESDEIKVKRGKEEITTTVKRETGKQLEIYLSNAASRVRRKSGQNTP
ncbi:uncharacterized protein [Paramormyrops kingsleyae]|uniref:uncharacterized protein isoform X1 n=2 Tax=Paramormyrops kingsleyae TaxID=1676925 RepID=UPI003B9778A9